MIYKASDVVNYKCILIFITTSSQVLNQDILRLTEIQTSFKVNIFVPDI